MKPGLDNRYAKSNKQMYDWRFVFNSMQISFVFFSKKKKSAEKILTWFNRVNSHGSMKNSIYNQDHGFGLEKISRGFVLARNQQLVSF